MLGGYYWNASGTLALVQTYDGSSFTPTAIPEPDDSIDGQVYSVSCPSPTYCVAVGMAPDSASGAVPLADIGTA